MHVSIRSGPCTECTLFLYIFGPLFSVLHKTSSIARPQIRLIQKKCCRMNVDSASHAFLSIRSGPCTECTLPFSFFTSKPTFSYFSPISENFCWCEHLFRNAVGYQPGRLGSFRKPPAILFHQFGLFGIGSQASGDLVSPGKMLEHRCAPSFPFESIQLPESI